MGFTDEKNDKKDFTEGTLLERKLIIEMLKYEDSIIKGDIGTKIYQNPSFSPTESFEAERAIIRLVLDKFDFKTEDSDVKNYNKIFKTYYKSPTEYDKEVLNSVAYMRENRCVYYTSPEVKVGDILKDCRIYDIDDKQTSIRESMGEFDHAFIAGFSNS